MIFSITLLLAFAYVNAADFDLTRRSSISTTAKLNITVLIDEMFVGVSGSSGASEVVLFFDKWDVLLPIKDSIFDAWPGNSFDDLSLFNRGVCSSTVWPSVGVSTFGEGEEILVFEDEAVNIFQFIDVADLVSYVNFPRPDVTFDVTAFIKESNNNEDCEVEEGTDKFIFSSNFTATLCSNAALFCTPFIRSSDDPLRSTSGWIELGDAGQPAYRMHLATRWAWYGTRRLVKINGQNFLRIRKMSTSSNTHDTPVTADRIPGMEFDRVIAEPGSAIVFELQPNGIPYRTLHCNDLFAQDTTFVFDLNGHFNDNDAAQAFKAGENFVIVIPDLVDVDFTFNTDNVDVPSLKAALVDAPTDFGVISADFQYVDRNNEFGVKLLSVTLTIGVTFPSTALTPAPTPAGTTRRIPQCPQQCSGHGACQADDTCQCAEGYRPSLVIGCENIAEADMTTDTRPTNTIKITVGEVKTFTDLVDTKVTEAPETRKDGLTNPPTPPPTPFPQPTLSAINDPESSATTISVTIVMVVVAIALVF